MRALRAGKPRLLAAFRILFEAGVTALLRSAADQQRHEESERTIGEMRGLTALAAARQASRRGE
jgi:hypothetical protein